MPVGIGSIFELLPQEESLDVPDSKEPKEEPKGTDPKEANPKEQDPLSSAVADGVKKRKKKKTDNRRPQDRRKAKKERETLEALEQQNRELAAEEARLTERAEGAAKEKAHLNRGRQLLQRRQDILAWRRLDRSNEAKDENDEVFERYVRAIQDEHAERKEKEKTKRITEFLKLDSTEEKEEFQQKGHLVDWKMRHQVIALRDEVFRRLLLKEAAERKEAGEEGAESEARDLIAGMRDTQEILQQGRARQIEDKESSEAPKDAVPNAAPKALATEFPDTGDAPVRKVHALRITKDSDAPRRHGPTYAEKGKWKVDPEVSAPEFGEYNSVKKRQKLFESDSATTRALGEFAQSEQPPSWPDHSAPNPSMAPPPPRPVASMRPSPAHKIVLKNGSPHYTRPQTARKVGATWATPTGTRPHQTSTGIRNLITNARDSLSTVANILESTTEPIPAPPSPPSSPPSFHRHKTPASLCSESSTGTIAAHPPRSASTSPPLPRPLSLPRQRRGLRIILLPTAPAPHTHPTAPPRPCQLCPLPGVLRCGTCYRGSFCSEAHFRAGYYTHRFLCVLLPEFLPHLRPPGLVRSVLFPVCSEGRPRPQFIWLPAMVPEVDEGVETDMHAPLLPRGRLGCEVVGVSGVRGRGLEVRFLREVWEVKGWGGGVNWSLRVVMGVDAGWWWGPVLVSKRRGGEGGWVVWGDVEVEDVNDLVDWLGDRKETNAGGMVPRGMGKWGVLEQEEKK